jgi:small subunit ribosomal protein S16
MSVSIRLAKIGKKYQPTYKVVAIPTRYKRVGEYLEVLGTYNPNLKPQEFKINKENYESWVKKGAIVSKAVSDLIEGTYTFKPYNPKAAKKAQELAKKQAEAQA